MTDSKPPAEEPSSLDQSVTDGPERKPTEDESSLDSPVDAALARAARSVANLWVVIRKEGVGAVQKEVAKKADNALGVADKFFGRIAGDDARDRKD